MTMINQLKKATVAEWGKLPQRLVDRAIGQWLSRARAAPASVGPLKHVHL